MNKWNGSEVYIKICFMKVEIESKSGFCFGVENAISIAEKALRSGEVIYCLGQIVHNEQEVERLKALGLVTVTNEEYEKLQNCRVLIRAHGEPPATYEKARENNIELIEATCPIVKQLQKKIVITHNRSAETGEQIVIFGKPGHPEVRGLVGQTGGNAILVSGEGDLDSIDYSKPVNIYSQTTMSRLAYSELCVTIREKYSTKGEDPDRMVKVNHTICGQVANREPSLREFARKHQVVIFVSGKESSNGKMLFSVCKEENDKSHFVSGPDDLDSGWFRDIESVGVCGATSTPKWLIFDIYKKIKSLG